MGTQVTGPNLNDARAISAAGERIYAEKYKADYERLYPGSFVAIDVTTGTATRAATASDAFAAARSQSPNGVFHLIRVGHSGAFDVGFAHRHATSDWLS